MTVETEVQTNKPETEVKDDLRSLVESAVESSGLADDEPRAKPAKVAKQEKTDDGVSGSSETSIEKSAAKTQEPGTQVGGQAAPTGGVEQPAEGQQAQQGLDAPRAWKADLRVKWAKIDPDVQAEITRRENEILRAFGDNSQARAFARQFHDTVQPYMARIQSMGSHPLKVVQEVLNADHILNTAPPVQKARYMANLIKTYGIDIRELDSALAGEAPNAQAVQMEQILAQRLQPFEQYMQAQQMQAQMAAQSRQEAAAEQIHRMSSDTVKYPHFETVRADMADIVELAAKRGMQLSLDEAYARACQMNPQVSNLLATQKTAKDAAAQRQAQAQRAQKAKAASASVSGSPASTVKGASAGEGGSLREMVEAAFNSALES